MDRRYILARSYKEMYGNNSCYYWIPVTSLHVVQNPNFSCSSPSYRFFSRYNGQLGRIEWHNHSLFLECLLGCTQFWPILFDHESKSMSWCWVSIFDYFTDVDECATEHAVCQDNALCVNIPGSYACQCKLGYSISDLACRGKYQGLLVSEHYYFRL